MWKTSRRGLLRNKIAWRRVRDAVTRAGGGGARVALLARRFRPVTVIWQCPPKWASDTAH